MFEKAKIGGKLEMLRLRFGMDRRHGSRRRLPKSLESEAKRATDDWQAQHPKCEVVAMESTWKRGRFGYVLVAFRQ